ncbi:hypothetical protein B0H11DRAFT_2190613 [Mycena galericulata]|nr:hypothetical protein B0H11DRAFT_2190613 [Mycena galericulata]
MDVTVATEPKRIEDVGKKPVGLQRHLTASGLGMASEHFEAAAEGLRTTRKPLEGSVDPAKQGRTALAHSRARAELQSATFSSESRRHAGTGSASASNSGRRVAARGRSYMVVEKLHNALPRLKTWRSCSRLHNLRYPALQFRETAIERTTFDGLAPGPSKVFDIEEIAVQRLRVRRSLWGTQGACAKEYGVEGRTLRGNIQYPCIIDKEIDLRVSEAALYRWTTPKDINEGRRGRGVDIHRCIKYTGGTCGGDSENSRKGTRSARAPLYRIEGMGGSEGAAKKRRTRGECTRTLTTSQARRETSCADARFTRIVPLIARASGFVGWRVLTKSASRIVCRVKAPKVSYLEAEHGTTKAGGTHRVDEGGTTALRRSAVSSRQKAGAEEERDAEKGGSVAPRKAEGRRRWKHGVGDGEGGVEGGEGDVEEMVVVREQEAFRTPTRVPALFGRRPRPARHRL